MLKWFCKFVGKLPLKIEVTLMDKILTIEKYLLL